MKKYIIRTTYSILLLTLIVSCKKYLDVVPDNVATIDNAFALRAQAEKFLYTCYSYLPRDANGYENPAFSGGDEIWRRQNSAGEMWNIARGMQNIVNPYGNGYWTNMYRALRDCNIFLDNIGRVPDMDEAERNRWIAEVKVLKAYYHFYLIRMYGPIPLVKQNLPIDATTEMVRVSRDPVDSCFNYVAQLLDEASADGNLPDAIVDPSRLGRITSPIALSLKAKVLVTAASPLFNGNMDQAGLRNRDGTQLFNLQESKEKWRLAAEACLAAINASEENGAKLYYFQGNVAQSLSDTIRTQLSIRNSLAERWNGEVIWANTQSESADLQRLASIGGLNPAYGDNVASSQALAPPLKIVEMFYTKNGVPINEDKTWSYASRYDLRKATAQDQLYVRKDYTTAALHFDREPRFYADLAFDGGVWFGQGRYDDNKPEDLFYLMAKNKQLHGQGDPTYGIVTGYLIKKLIHYQNVEGHVREYSVTPYPWPLIRLADLYLMYAEALNESEGPSNPDIFTYLDQVRLRAGLQPVAISWDTYSSTPNKYKEQEGLRKIIQQERMIELAFEGHRFWDLRRWKQAVQTMNAPIRSWDLIQESAAAYYRPKIIWNQTFSNRDYFWPISENNITVNPNLVQNLGW